MFFNFLQRKKNAKGHGIHSPFAFNFITNVINEKHWYNAFFDINKLLSEQGVKTDNSKLHHLSYRLVRFFQPEKVLEIEPGENVNALYICSAYDGVRYHCFDSAQEKILLARNLHDKFSKNIVFIDKLNSSQIYDALFVRLNAFPVDTESLFSMSCDNTFWVITGIKSRNGKRFWKKIVKDERARLTFDMKDTGIVILKESYHKASYLI